MDFTIWRRLAVLAVLPILAGAIGCSKGYPVSGKVSFEDGTPLDRGIIIVETKEGEKKVGGQGSINPDGTFSMGTDKPGNGLPPGKYKVLVLPPDLNEKQREAGMTDPIDGKWQRYESSGLELEVTGPKEDFNITVSKPKGAKKK